MFCCTDVATASVTVSSRARRAVYLKTMPTSQYRTIPEDVVPNLTEQVRQCRRSRFAANASRSS